MKNSNIEEEKTEIQDFRIYQDRIRILLIIYYFSDDYDATDNKGFVKVFKSEVKIQAIDFLIRYPDYLAYELLNLLISDGKLEKEQIKEVVKEIFTTNEPIIRNIEMEKFFFGAYEDIDDIIAFLVSISFIHFESKKRSDGRIGEKYYYLTKLGVDKIEKELKPYESLQWYFTRCQLIKTFFGDESGSNLKALQYNHKEYKDTALKEYIPMIVDKTKNMYKDIFGEDL